MPLKLKLAWVCTAGAEVPEVAPLPMDAPPSARPLTGVSKEKLLPGVLGSGVCAGLSVCVCLCCLLWGHAYAWVWVWVWVFVWLSVCDARMRAYTRARAHEPRLTHQGHKADAHL